MYIRPCKGATMSNDGDLPTSPGPGDGDPPTEGNQT